MDSNKTTVEIIIAELKTIIEPFYYAVQDGSKEEFYSFLKTKGVDFGAPEDGIDISEFCQSFSDTFELVNNALENQEIDFIQLLHVSKNCFQALDDINNIDFPEEIINNLNLTEVIVNNLLIEYLYYGKPVFYYFFVLIGIIVPAKNYNERVEAKIKWSQLFEFIQNPLNALKKLYSWNDPSYTPYDFLNKLQAFLETINIHSYYKIPNVEKLDLINYEYQDKTEDFDLQLLVPLFSFAENENTASNQSNFEFGIGIFPKLSSDPSDSGFSIFIYGDQTTSIEYDLNNDWKLKFSTSLKAGLSNEDIGFIITPGKIELKLPESAEELLSFLTKVSIIKNVQSGTKDELLNIFGSKLKVGEIGSELGIKFTEGQLEFFIDFLISYATFELNFSEGDGFIQKITPDENMVIDFDFKVGFSSLRGIHFNANAAFEFSLAKHIDLGFAKIENITISLNPFSDSPSLAVASSISTQLGPVSAAIKDIGIAAQAQFYGFDTENNTKGNLGPLDLSLGFKHPTGVDLSIDASGIVGGGFLKFDNANKRYTGVLTLNFEEIGLTAIGLITTKMPDGSEGFALLINIGTTFNPPMQLSMGFNLSGVGGLIGVNRSIEIDALRTGLKNRTLDSILFPDTSTVIANASKIISDLRTVFPPAEERYVVGPMVKIGWGSPTIITADIGIFLEFPDPVRIVLLGQVEAALPEEKKALVVIHLDVLGVLDFAKEELTFQASLYDSRILAFTLFGDSAFLLGWGCDPRFALSLGGFHPKFTPPPPPIVFADLKRLTLDIGTGSKLQLACRAYLALTPNSLQFGARVDLYASAGGLTAEGHLGFDALFYLSPFSFEVEICGGVHLKYKGLSLLEINLTLLLSGPTPWHARGKAKISLLFFSIKVGFSITWGEREKVTLAPIDAWQPLQDALAAAGNWSSGLPAGRTLVESLRGFEEDAPGKIIVHPAGRLEVRQNVVPLGICLDKVGNAPITGHDLFDIKDLIVDVEDLIVEDKSLNPEPVQEFFARGQFEELTSDQKLSVPSFERMKGGVTTAASEMVRIDGEDNVVEYKPVTYESILIKRDSTSELQQPDGEFEWEEAQFIAAAGITRKAIRRAGPRKRFSSLHPRPKVGVREEAYCIANAEDLTRATLSSELDHENRNMTRMAADQVLRAQIELEPEQANNLLVVPEYEVYEVIA